MVEAIPSTTTYPATTASTTTSLADPADVQRFESALDSGSAEDADLLAQIDKNMQDDIMRKIVADTFKNAREMFRK